MELSGASKNALVQLLAQSINAKLQQMSITHTNKDRGNSRSPAQWNASYQANTKQLRTAVKCSASAANGNLIILIWLGYDVKPKVEGSSSSIAFDDMEAGVDDTGSNGDYPVVFESGTTPPVEYFAVEPGGSRPTYEDNSGQEPKYPVYDGSTASPFPIPGAGTIAT